MANKGKLYVSLASVLSLTLAGQFVYFPVFAEGPVDISIVEKVNDGTGNYKDWEDITDAMPGMSYSAIPQVKNNGTISVPVTMCITESGVDEVGNVAELDEGTFRININDTYWTRVSGEDSGGTVTSPIVVCYKYNSELAVGEITEPLFYEVYLSERLGNEHQNATFNLHLEAYAGEEVPVDSETEDEILPNNPNTGEFTNSEPLTTTGYVFLSLGAVTLTGMVLYLLRKTTRKNR